MRRFALAMLVGLWTQAAMAQAIYTCEARGGATSYQSMPCAPGMRTVRTRAVPPPSPETPASNAQRERERRRQAEAARYLASLAGTDQRPVHRTSSKARTPTRHARCEAARRQRDDTLQRVGLKRTYELLRRLDDIVYDACK